MGRIHSIEYALAFLGSLLVWRRAAADPAGALADYRRALGYGGTLDLPGLFAAAGSALAFDRETVRAAVAFAEARINLT